MKKECIIITGAGQRIGLALAHFFNQSTFDALPYQVLISYRTKRDSVTLLNAQGVKCIQADFSTDQGIYTFSEAVIDFLKDNDLTIRALIHNASDWAAEKYSDHIAALHDQMMQIHVKTPYLLNQLLYPYFKKHHQTDKKNTETNDTIAVADIIHFTDYVVSKGSAKHIAYAASKSALENLTLSFAQKFAPQIKVNSIAPALILFNEHDDEAYKSKARKKALMPIAPGEQEIINVVQCVMHSRFMTGQCFHVDGGRALKS